VGAGSLALGRTATTDFAARSSAVPRQDEEVVDHGPMNFIEDMALSIIDSVIEHVRG
jgi:hypothetical protein